MVFWSCLLSLSLWLRVSSVKVDLWNITVDASVVGLIGSCVVIPCNFSYHDNGKKYTEFTGIWYKENEKSKVYHPNGSQIINSFKGRTSLTGDLSKNDCSLKISSLGSSDAGSYMFRIEIKGLANYTYDKEKEIVYLKVNETPETPSISVEEEVTSGKPVTATCAVYHSCPSDLPRVTWSHSGTESSPSQPQNHDQLKITYYNLTFTPSREDHNKNLSCSANFTVKTVTGNKTLKVKDPPNDVSAITKASVKDQPHTEAISCTASNTEGKSSSDPWKPLTSSEDRQIGIIIYIAVASAVVVVLACILVYVVRRRCGKSATQLHAMRNEQNEMKITQNKYDIESKEEKGSDEDIYTNFPNGRVYDNWGSDVRPFSSDHTLEDEEVYANT